jgi:hypothetical protein
LSLQKRKSRDANRVLRLVQLRTGLILQSGTIGKEKAAKPTTNCNRERFPFKHGLGPDNHRDDSILPEVDNRCVRKIKGDKSTRLIILSIRVVYIISIYIFYLTYLGEIKLG